MREFLTSAYENVLYVFNHVYAWVLYALAFVASFLGETGVMYSHCIIAVVFADIVFGIWKSHKKGQGFSPKKLFKKIPYLALYLVVMLLFHIVDVVVGEDTTICMKSVAIFVVVIEVWSVLGNLCIIFPQMALLSIVQKFLLTTVSEKVNMTEDELKEAIENVKDAKNPQTDPFQKPAAKSEVIEDDYNHECTVDESVNGGGI